MDRRELSELLLQVSEGRLSPDDAIAKINTEPYEDLGYARVDHDRSIRTGIGEVIFGQNKTAPQISGIVSSMLSHGAKSIIITRLAPDASAEISSQIDAEYEYCPSARLAVVARDRQRPLRGCVVVATAGTSDIPIAEEAALTAEALGSRVERLFDVGVAGLHRLLSKMDVICGARAIVAVAGMEGALASVIGGLVSCPVIAVPTSVGYGASFGGVAALLSMLNSCASGVSVVNIDNGFGAGYLASIINNMEGIE